MIGPKLRIISGPVAVIEQQLNELLGDYVMNLQNFAVVKDELIITCFLIHASEVRKMQLVTMGPMPGVRQ